MEMTFHIIPIKFLLKMVSHKLTNDRNNMQRIHKEINHFLRAINPLNEFYLEHMLLSNKPHL